MQALLRLAPKTARRLNEGAPDERVPIANVKVGDHIRARPGEAVPVVKAVGAKVIGGTMNGTGALMIEARQVGADSASPTQSRTGSCPRSSPRP
jgi:Cu+-exporting ATPase